MITTGWQRRGWGRRAGDGRVRVAWVRGLAVRLRAGSCPARNAGILAVTGRRLPIMNALAYRPLRRGRFHRNRPGGHELRAFQHCQQRRVAQVGRGARGHHAGHDTRPGIWGGKCRWRAAGSGAGVAGVVCGVGGRGVAWSFSTTILRKLRMAWFCANAIYGQRLWCSFAVLGWSPVSPGHTSIRE
jgi:hypothetical protein